MYWWTLEFIIGARVEASKTPKTGWLIAFIMTLPLHWPHDPGEWARIVIFFFCGIMWVLCLPKKYIQIIGYNHD